MGKYKINIENKYKRNCKKSKLKANAKERCEQE